MANRTPTSPNGRNADTDAPTAQHDLTQPLEAAYDPAGPDGLHRHDGGRAELHQQGGRPHIHADDGTVVFLHPSATDRAEAGWFESQVSSDPDQPTADLTPASGVASAGSQPRDGDDAGAGRPLARDPATGRFLPRHAAPDLFADVDLRLEDLDAQADAVEANCFGHAELVTDVSLAVFDAEVAAFLDLASACHAQIAGLHRQVDFADAAERERLLSWEAAYLVAADRIGEGGGGS
jgi:hypothetical protein